MYEISATVTYLSYKHMIGGTGHPGAVAVCISHLVTLYGVHLHTHPRDFDSQK
jgi:hypothetical protein